MISSVAEVVQKRDNHCEDVARQVMKFSAKYEILKSVARGEIEAFAVRNRTSGERQLAYIFPCTEPPEDQPTAQWILVSFAILAPDAPGIALDMGKYDVANLAYVIMSLPEPDVLDAWVHRYQEKADSRAPQNSSGPAAAAAPEPRSGALTVQPEGVGERSSGNSSAAPEERDLPKLSTGQDNAAGETLFEGFGSQKPREPGEFTRQFFREVVADDEVTRVDSEVTSRREDGFTNRFEQRPAAGANSVEAPSGLGSVPSGVMRTGGDSNSPSGFSTNMFGQAMDGGSPSPKHEFGDSEPARLSTGEFTRFFQGPSERGEGATAEDRSTIEPIGPRMETGEFTKIFGFEAPVVAGEPNLHQPVLDHSSISLHGSSTEILDQHSAPREGRPDGGYGFETKTNVQTSDDGSSTRVFEQPRNSSVTTPPRTSPGLFSSDAIPSPSHLEAAAAGGATVFFPPAAEIAVEAEAGSGRGPSDYTVFMSRDALASSASQSGGAMPSPSSPMGGGAAAAGAALASQFVTPPAVPSYQPPTPQVPAYPSTPAMSGSSVPGMPALTPPVLAAPSVPMPSAQPSPSPKSYWPLIITLNVLFLLAILLIVYFALKH